MTSETALDSALPAVASGEPVPAAPVLRPIVRTALALLSVQGVTWIASVVAITVVPRYLGARDLGILATVMAATGIGARIASFGTARLVTHVVARERHRAAAITCVAIAARVYVSVPLLAAGVAVAALAGAPSLVVTLLLLSGATSVMGLISEAANAALQGDHSLGRASAVASVVAVAGQAFAVAVLVEGGGVTGMAAVGSVVALLTAITTAAIAFRRFGWAGPGRPAELVNVARKGLPFLAWDLALLVYGSIDLVLIPLLTDSHTAGEYAFAYRLASMPIFIAAIVTAAVFPTLSRAAGSDDAQFGRVMRRAASVTFVATLPLSIGLATLSREVAPLAGGSDFRSAAPLLAIISLHIPVAAADTILGTALFALRRERRFAVVAWVAAGLNPIAIVVVVPVAAHAWGDGAIGAAIVTVATELFIAANIWWMLRSFLPLRPMLQPAAMVALIGAAMALSVFVTVNVAGLMAAVLAGAIAYAAGSAALRVIDPGELMRAGRELRPGG